MGQQELSPVAVIVLGWLTRSSSRLNVVQLSATARIPLATVQAAVEELVGARRVRVAAGGGLILLPPAEIDLTSTRPVSAQQQEERPRQRGRIEALLPRERPPRDDSVEPI